MAKSTITVKIAISWIDKYCYLPFLKAMTYMGLEFDVKRALEGTKKRMKFKVN